MRGAPVHEAGPLSSQAIFSSILRHHPESPEFSIPTFSMAPSAGHLLLPKIWRAARYVACPLSSTVLIGWSHHRYQTDIYSGLPMRRPRGPSEPKYRSPPSLLSDTSQHMPESTATPSLAPLLSVKPAAAPSRPVLSSLQSDRACKQTLRCTGRPASVRMSAG